MALESVRFSSGKSLVKSALVRVVDAAGMIKIVRHGFSARAQETTLSWPRLLISTPRSTDISEEDMGEAVVPFG